MPLNYSGQNLRGRNFKGQDLAGANFSYADIRSADFSGAKLRGANFSHVKAGLQKRWAIFLVGVSWLLSGATGFVFAYVGALIYYVFDSSREPTDRILGWTSLVVVIVVFIVIILQGVNTAIAVIIAVAFVFAIAFTVTGYGTGTDVVVFAKAFVGAGTDVEAISKTFVGAGAFVAAGAVVGTLLSIYTRRRALKGDEKYVFIRNIAIAFAAIGGTSFHNANLTDATFQNATLKSTDFRKANLTRTCFHKTKKLDRVRPGTTYLEKVQVRQLLVTGQGQDKNFDRQDLRGVNFKGANLIDASFIGANFSEANLQDADLSRAKLVQAQLDGTDFTGANLTGAYIEDWGITSDTKFDGVRCKYVYMRFPTKENPDPMRKPDNREEVFADGEFGDFIKPMFDTLDLYHNQGVDPRAIAISFKQLAENHSETELRIVGMEVKGEDKFLLRAKTAPEADKSELSAEYFEMYNRIKALAEQELKALIVEKDSRIRSLEIFVTQALQSPKFYAENYRNQGATMSQSPKKESNFNFQNPQFAGGLVNADRVTANQIGGNITNYTQEQKQNLAQAAAEIQQLLFQLSQANPTTNEEVTEAIHQEIKRNPTLKARLQSALKAGGLEALKAIFNHPLFNIPSETIKGWLEVE